MSRTERREAIRTQVALLGHVPSVRRMARALACPRATIAEDYRVLELKSRVAAGRPVVEAPIATVPVTFRVPAATYDHYCRVAASGRVPVQAAIRAAVIAGTRTT